MYGNFTFILTLLLALPQSFEYLSEKGPVLLDILLKYKQIQEYVMYVHPPTNERTLFWPQEDWS